MTETAKKKILRNMARYMTEDQIRNTAIRNKLSIFNLNNRIKEIILNWIHHAEIMEPECIPES
jgi:hypothetical protein